MANTVSALSSNVKQYFLLFLFYILYKNAFGVVETAPSKPSVKVQILTVEVSGRSKIASVSENYICATLDWWPPDKCDYGSCSWGESSLLNLDLTNPVLQNAVKGLSPLMLRLGGTLQDKVFYDVGKLQGPCHPFSPGSGLFNFTEGCLNMSRWQALNVFFQKTGSLVAFGLNALYGRQRIGKFFFGAWDPSNAQDFIQYTFNHSYHIQAWELGNELTSSGVGASIPASQYAADVKKLRAVVNQIYAKSPVKPLIVAPDGFFVQNFYQQLLELTGPNILNACTRHIYNLGAGVDKTLVNKILDPVFLSQEAGVFKLVQKTMQAYGPWAQSWVGEAGGAYNSGHNLVSNAFVFSFWYVDQLGMAAQHNTQMYCRQSLVGGHYGLLNTSTFHPNPDFYSALLWKRLMGRVVLSTTSSGSPYLRAYAHCSKTSQQALAVVLINLSNTTQYNVELSLSISSAESENVSKHMTSVPENMNIDTQGAAVASYKQRLEYHLAAPGGNLHSQIVLLNGKPLQVAPNGTLPTLTPMTVDNSLPISVAPTSIVFAVVPAVIIPACIED
ncbi:hypothetical protein O6H91_14G004200 [Diphasiastrum complanatum]|uniref:Uncharacterized protein n=10 Tax=Diphasiastrum complanatum TaxID=34168 RepID=A0ACC2BL12_DIPCM|nr:hypothetical protein O6H91_14G004200 [Diphasiastrum complanatum]KAJ7530446.1 hypothetical protein O6H91_14G004200 [Diphasiastrum complanatum]KAJ7530447.1 hypothetical protein O6H91_14G004200 [Diphasiastrum complanatum]KAJ7530448.1 hypothetical protein O6H91_14G004200 [Diphasiastrum complanatum]KAJ7530449.1 hypothetical protein O6H91_14G004200 [Diphasiastrum complanatum]